MTFGSSANNWSFGIAANEGNSNANSYFALSVYVYRPSTASVVGFINDSDTAHGSEWSTSEDGRSTTFTGSSVVAAENDILVLEVWRHTPGQTKGNSYTQAIYFDGTTDVDNPTSTTEDASWIEYNGTITWKPSGRTRRIWVV